MKGLDNVEGEATEPKILGDTVPRTDHSKNDKMRDGVELYDKRMKEWELNKNDPVYRANNKKPSLRPFAKEYGLPIYTFPKYACTDVSKRRKIGEKPGSKSMVSDENAEFLIQNAIRSDRANQGKSITNTIDGLLDLQP